MTEQPATQPREFDPETGKPLDLADDQRDDATGADAEPVYDPNQRLVDPSKGTDEPPNTGSAESDDQAAEVETPADGPPAEAGELDMRDQGDAGDGDANDVPAGTGG